MVMDVVRPIKFKRRKVSAVRDFPRGCGPSSVGAVALKRPIGSPDLPSGLLVKFDGTSRTDDPNGLHVSSLPPATPLVTLITDQSELPKEGCRQSSNQPGLSKLDFDLSELPNGNSCQPELLKLNSDQLKLLKDSSCQMVLLKGSSDQLEQLGAVKTVDLNSKHLSSRRYPPPKRRKVSAVRDYPHGCGRVSQSIKDGSLDVTPLAPVKCKSLNAEKAHAVNQQLSIESSAEFKYTLTDPAEVKKVETKQTCEVLRDNDGESRDNDGEKKLATEQLALPETSIRAAPVKCKSLNAEKAHAVNQKLSIESSAEFKYTLSDTTEVKKVEAKQTCEVLHDSDVEGHDNDGEKKLATKQLALPETSIRAAPVESFNGEAKRNDVKQVTETAQEIPNGARVKSSSKSYLGEIVVEECSNLNIVARSDLKKNFELHDLKQLSESFAIEKTSSSKPSLDSRSQPGIKFRIKTGSSMAGKPHLMGPVKHPGDSKDLKRKFKEEVEDDQTKAGGSMEACDDKIVVQALMASQTCPWRQGGKSGVITDCFATPIKVQNGMKSLTKNSGMKGASSVSRLKDEVYSSGEEDYTPTAEENGQALVIYKNPREVTLTPLVPPRPNNRSDNEVLSDRSKVKRVLRLFQVASRKLLQELESKPRDQQRRRVDLMVSAQLKERGLWVNYDGSGTIGHVPGVEVGDEFHYRVELSIVGLHRPFQGGIDYMKKNGRVLATSIVASGGYKDDMDNSDVLIYHGSGGSPAVGGKPAVDQKLERGNLGLKNSIDAKSPVRVIHGFKELKLSHRDAKAKAVSTFTYDGLYVVEECRKEMGPEGFSVFKFQLRRMAGQAELALKEAKRSKKARIREGLCIEDISGGKETLPICAVNTIDDDRPIPFKYITENMYPSSYVHIPPSGCNCTHGCSESSVSEKCACTIKNAGENPFNNDGAIVEARPLVYECGPSCRCPPSCYNRVSQHGIQIRLELFKTKSRGWGVRSLDSIPSGTFICEYIGEMLQDSDAELRSNDEYLFDIGHNYEDPSLWEGFRTFTPSSQSSSICKTNEELGFTIDAAEYGNIGRFINHSCSPNIYAQNVLYDHDDKRMPHIMFFAADNIPPLQELTYHYNYSVDQVHDSEGNIKRKTCYCGSPDCTGRLY